MDPVKVGLKYRKIMYAYKVVLQSKKARKSRREDFSWASDIFNSSYQDYSRISIAFFTILAWVKAGPKENEVLWRIKNIFLHPQVRKYRILDVIY